MVPCILISKITKQGTKLALISVLTGDIVNSRTIAAEDYDAMLYTLQQTLEQIKSKHNIIYEVFRGDSFQATFKTPTPSMRSAILLKTKLLSVSNNEQPWDIRLALGIGQYTDIRQNSGTSTGEAYILSGNGVELIKNSEIGVYCNNQQFNEYLLLPTQFVNHLLNSITSKQAGAIAAYIQSDFSDHADVCKIIGGSRSNASKLLRRSGATLIRDYILLFEKQLKRIAQ